MQILHIFAEIKINYAAKLDVHICGLWDFWEIVVWEEFVRNINLQ